MTYPRLLEPAALGKIQLRNRSLVAPMTRISAQQDGTVGPLMPAYYTAFGQGGFGAVITEGVYTDQHFSQGYQYQPGITDAAQADSWASLITSVKATGAKVIMQLMHAGALSQYNRFASDTRGPSAIAPKGTQMTFYRGVGAYPTPLEMTPAEIEAAIDGFVQSAVRAQEAGADGVEVHGANGYLLDQFLTDYANQRSDQYGKGVQGRIQLTCEVIQRVREAVGKEFTVGVRISQGKVNDFDHKWQGKEADAKVIFGAVEASGADYIHTTEFEASAPAFGAGKSLAALAKETTNLPIIANGSLGNPEQTERLIAQGQFDFAAIGKDALASPDWADRIKHGHDRKAFDFAMFSPLADLQSANDYLLADV
ncbi:MAG: NADH:flavin oxidoreductase [Thalassovita sp.]